MIILLVGDFGSGKTREAVKLVKSRADQGLNVYSNMKLQFQHERIEEIDLKEDIRNCVLFLDEIHTVVDARRSGTGETLSWTYLFSQTRKSRCDVIGTSQYANQVEMRFRNFIDLMIVAEAIEWETIHGERCAKRFRYTAVRRDGLSQNWEEDRGEEVKLYDSWEVVHKQETTFTKKPKQKKDKVQIKPGKTIAARTKGLPL